MATSPTPPSTIRWPVEVTRPGEHFTQVYRGEAVRICCILAEYAKPMDLAGATADFYWQPIPSEDPTAWYEAPAGAATVSGDTVSILFDAATMDSGAVAYRCFFRLTTAGGATYRANGTLGMLPSPGALPNEIPFPPRIIDFALVEVRNPPWPAPSSAEPQMDGTAAAGESADYARGDHRHPTDTSRAPASHTHAQGDVTGLTAALAGKASTADATLNARGLGAWTVRETYNNKPIILVWSSSGWTPYGDESAIGSAKGDAESTVLDWAGEVDAAIDIHATRTANTSGYSGWSVDPPFIYDTLGEEYIPASVPAWGECQDPVSGEYVDGWGFAQMYSGITVLISTDRNATSLSYDDMGTTFNCVRTQYPGYTLGTQSDKPLASPSDIPDVVDPATATASGKVADALATKQALAEKLDKSGGTMTGNIVMSGSTRIGFGSDAKGIMQSDGELEVHDFQSENGSKLIPDGSNFLTQNRHNLLPYASPTVASGAFALDPATAVYRMDADLSGTAATIPTPDVTNIPTGQQYFCFEMEVFVDGTATSLAGPLGWTWLDGGELPTSASGFSGKTLYIACRLDCGAADPLVLANVWRVA